MPFLIFNNTLFTTGYGQTRSRIVGGRWGGGMRWNQSRKRQFQMKLEDKRICPYCLEVSSRTNLSRHITHKHSDELQAQGKQLFKCTYCRNTYRSMNQLQVHIAEKHNNGSARKSKWIKSMMYPHRLQNFLCISSSHASW